MKSQKLNVGEGVRGKSACPGKESQARAHADGDEEGDEIAQHGGGGSGGGRRQESASGGYREGGKARGSEVCIVFYVAPSPSAL